MSLGATMVGSALCGQQPVTQRVPIFHNKLLESEYVGDSKSVTDPSRVPRVSLVQVLADPKRFEGKTLCISGFAHIEFENHALYLSRDDSDFLITENALWLNLNPDDWEDAGVTPEEFNNKFVQLVGVFASGESGHLGVFSGAMERIWYMRTLSQMKK